MRDLATIIFMSAHINARQKSLAVVAIGLLIYVCSTLIIIINIIAVGYVVAESDIDQSCALSLIHITTYLHQTCCELIYPTSKYLFRPNIFQKISPTGKSFHQVEFNRQEKQCILLPDRYIK